MKFEKIYLSGSSKKQYDEDFVVGYKAENGMKIETQFLFNNYQYYMVGNKSFDKLAEAKAYIELMEGKRHDI